MWNLKKRKLSLKVFQMFFAGRQCAALKLHPNDCLMLHFQEEMCLILQKTENKNKHFVSATVNINCDQTHVDWMGFACRGWKVTAGSQRWQLMGQMRWEIWPWTCPISHSLEMNAGFLSPPWLRGNVGNRWQNHRHTQTPITLYMRAFPHLPDWKNYLSCLLESTNHHFINVMSPVMIAWSFAI